ncbi:MULTISPECIES: hypothetical protein [unclassified Pseudomonas]|uniref:hypothetical protein n=1 Tax=unclassified Pseudomonas TaxID=196821 RepID=UPI000C2FAC5F|nr:MULTISPECIES: hypothetical protein [unclassified Pseudomonas]MCU1736342.1 hypothetical protein [Pseudomonas sp. 20S_6.2_Bac1]
MKRIHPSGPMTGLPDDPYDRFKARQQKKAGKSAESRQEYICTPVRSNASPFKSAAEQRPRNRHA